jgi:hypothetical protein
LHLSASNDLRNRCDRNGVFLCCRSSLLFIRLACAACICKFVQPTFGLEASSAASNDYDACDTDQIIVVNPRTLDIVRTVEA